MSLATRCSGRACRNSDDGSPQPGMSSRSLIAVMLVSATLLLSACGDRATEDAALQQHQAEQQATASGLEQAAERVFTGICDGSAAVLLDDATLLVAYDEVNTLFAFPLSGGAATARFDLDRLLELPSSAEIDIEAATRAGDRIWWIGSHGRDADGNDAPNRRLLFATSVPSPGLQDLQLRVAPQDLTSMLLVNPEVRAVLNKAVRKRAPKAGGVNIEGLATTAEGGLLLGFRSPLSAPDGLTGKALLVGLVPDGDRFRVQSVSQLDLDDRGVRDIASHAGGFVMIAGPAKSAGGFALYAWDGRGERAEALQPIADLHAEALVDTGSHWLLLSDDGKQLRADTESSNGFSRCDSIRQHAGAGAQHPGVFFRGRLVAKQ